MEKTEDLPHGADVVVGWGRTVQWDDENTDSSIRDVTGAIEG